MVAIIVARSRNLVIGRDGALPWRLPSDMRRFRELTSGHAVAMGRKTFESLPAKYRPLPDRRNLVLSRNPRYRAAGAEVFARLQDALDACAGDCFVIGGSQIYSLALPLAERVYLTHVDEDHEGDALFPALPEERWSCVEESEPLIENGHRLVFRVYERTAHGERSSVRLPGL